MAQLPPRMELLQMLACRSYVGRGRIHFAAEEEKPFSVDGPRILVPVKLFMYLIELGLVLHY